MVIRLKHRVKLDWEYVWAPLFCLSGGFLGSVSGLSSPASLSNNVGFMPRLRYSSSTHHSPEGFIQMKTG